MDGLGELHWDFSTWELFCAIASITCAAINRLYGGSGCSFLEACPKKIAIFLCLK